MKEDCFAYRHVGRTIMCLALENMECVNSECKFYKKDGTQCDSCLDYGNISKCKSCKMIRQRGNRRYDEM